MDNLFIVIKCRDCGHTIDDPRFHFNAPGTSWGAALHWFKPPIVEPHACPCPDGICRCYHAGTV